MRPFHDQISRLCSPQSPRLHRASDPVFETACASNVPFSASACPCLVSLITLFFFASFAIDVETLQISLDYGRNSHIMGSKYGQPIADPPRRVWRSSGMEKAVLVPSVHGDPAMEASPSRKKNATRSAYFVIIWSN